MARLEFAVLGYVALYDVNEAGNLRYFLNTSRRQHHRQSAMFQPLSLNVHHIQNRRPGHYCELDHYYRSALVQKK